jgi:hypothetical protein
MSYPTSDRTAVRVKGALGLLDGAALGAARAPDMKLWSYGVGVERQLVASRVTGSGGSRQAAARQRPLRWVVVGDVGLGATRFDSNDFVPGAGEAARDFKKTYLATDAGLTVKYRAAQRLQLFAGARGNLTFADKSDTAVLAALDPRAQARAFGSAVTIPVSAGLTLRM